MSKLTQIVRGERQKEIARIFDEACGRHNRWQVWSDAMVMFAVSISNAVDKAHAERREEIYLTLAKKYNQREMDCIARMFAVVIEALEANPDQDFLGDLYMSLELGNKKSGQFFTPYSVCTMVAKMQSGIKEKIEAQGWVSVSDPACGAGATLIALANECMRQNINYQSSVLFVAQDIDFVTGCMCYIQLSLLGCPGYVVVADTLANPSTSIDDRGLIPTPGDNIWYTPFYFRDEWHWRRVAYRMDSILKKASPVETAPAAVVTPPEPAIIFNETEKGQFTLF